MGASKDNEVMLAIPSRSALGKQRVAGHDKRCQVGGASSLASDAAGARSRETKEVRQSLCSRLLNHRQGGGHLEYVQLGLN